eukprot:195054-Chlamydomonas_euryale.AAC.1
MDGWTDGQPEGWTEGRMDGYMDVGVSVDARGSRAVPGGERRMRGQGDERTDGRVDVDAREYM